MAARLTVHFPLRPTRRLLLRDGGEYVLGRDPECDVVLDDDRVSRRHARLAAVDGTWRLTDLESKNGVTVDGRPVPTAEVRDGAWLGIGGLLARFETTSEEREHADSHRLAARWRTSISLRRELQPSLGIAPLLERVLDSVLELAEAERGFILLRRAEGDLGIAARRQLSDHDLSSREFSGSAGAIERALREGLPVAVSDAQADTFLKQRESIVAGGIRALVVLPLTAADRQLGVVYADSRRPGAAFGELDVEILEGLAAHAALAVAVASLDGELQGIAARLPLLPGVDAAAVEALAREVGRARERLTPAPGRIGVASSWNDIAALHRTRTGSSG